MSARNVPWPCASSCLSIIRRIALIVRMQDAVLADEGRAVRQVKHPESSGSVGYMINGNSTDSGLFEPESVKNLLTVFDAGVNLSYHGLWISIAVLSNLITVSTVSCRCCHSLPLDVRTPSS